jgi:hypothetical protein
LIYIEYISRRSGAELSNFHEFMSKGLEGWDASYEEDKLILGMSRTWRLGPEPEHIGVWYSPRVGFERIDDWDRIFRSGEADYLEQPLQKVARIDAAGCYETLLEPVPGRNGTYYAEFFRAQGELSAIREFYEGRMRRHQRFTLNLLVHRIGRLGPDPGALAVWTLPNFAALAEIADELDRVREPVQLQAAGTYTDVGQEII